MTDSINEKIGRLHIGAAFQQEKMNTKNNFYPCHKFILLITFCSFFIFFKPARLSIIYMQSICDAKFAFYICAKQKI